MNSFDLGDLSSVQGDFFWLFFSCIYDDEVLDSVIVAMIPL